MALPDPSAKERGGSSKGLNDVGDAKDAYGLDHVEPVWTVDIDRIQSD